MFFQRIVYEKANLHTHTQNKSYLFMVHLNGSEENFKHKKKESILRIL